MFDEYISLPTPPIPPFDEMPRDRAGLWKFMSDLYLSEESIRVVAHGIWVRDRCQDGERPAEEFGWRWEGMRLRDAHWLQARMMLEVVLEGDFDTVWFAMPS